MADLVAKLVWYRIREAAVSWRDRIDRISRVDEWLWGEEKMDPLGLLLLGWILFAGVVYLSTGYVKELLIRMFGEPEVRQQNGAVVGARNNRPLPPATQPARTHTPASASPSPTPLGDETREISGSPLNNSPSSETLQARVKLINYSQEGSDWVNHVLNWLYHRYNTTPEFAEIWLSALNEYAKKNAQQLGILVTFDRFLPTSRAPKIGDVRAELSADEQLSIFCSVETVQLGFSVLATVTTDSNLVTTESYDVDIDHVQNEMRFLNINDMRQHVQPTTTQLLYAQTHGFQLMMNIYTSPQNEFMLSAEFENKQIRDMRVDVRLPPAKSNPFGDEFDPSVLQEAVKQCILNTITVIKLTRFREFPYPFWHHPNSKPSSPTKDREPLQTDFPFNPVMNGPKSLPFGPGDHQVVVKVVRASGLGQNTPGIEPYCVIEMDEPPQKHTTSIVKSSGTNPVWDETFRFDISTDTSEILFELYDRTKPQKRNFLGTAIVSLHELRRNPSQRQIIPLQSRPLMDDLVSGTLTLEFVVLAGGVPLSNTVLDVSAQHNPVGSSKLGSNPNRNSHVYADPMTINNNAAGEASTGDRRMGAPKPPSVQRSYSEDAEILNMTTKKHKSKPLKRKLSATDGHLRDADDSSVDTNDADGKGRSRSVDRKPSLFSRIKRRLSFGKKRSKSLDPTTAKQQLAASASLTPGHNGSQYQTLDSTDPETTALLEADYGSLSRKQRRARDKASHKRSKSAPGSREPSATRSTASTAIGGSHTPPLGLMRDDERLHNSLVFLLATTGNTPQRSWKDKLRSRFAKKSHTETIITTEHVEV